MSGIALSAFLLLVVAVLAWLLGITPGRARPEADDANAADPDDLAAAEDDVAQLDAFATPEDAEEELPDWGPGAPK